MFASADTRGISLISLLIVFVCPFQHSDSRQLDRLHILTSAPVRNSLSPNFVLILVLIRGTLQFLILLELQHFPQVTCPIVFCASHFLAVFHRRCRPALVSIHNCLRHLIKLTQHGLHDSGGRCGGRALDAAASSAKQSAAPRAKTPAAR